MKDRNGIVGNTDKNNLIGSAIIDEFSNIILADELVYIFLGTSYTIPFKEYILPEYKDEFMAKLEMCSYSHKIFVSKCRRYDGETIDVSIVMYIKLIGEKQYINIDLYDIGYMTREFSNYLLDDRVFDKYINMTDKILFTYDVENRIITVNKNRDTIFRGSMNTYRQTVIENQFIEKSYLEQFVQMCDAIENCDGDGFYRLETTFFSGEGSKEYQTTYASFSTVEYNSQVAYTVGYFSNGISASAKNYENNRADLDPLTGLLNKKAIYQYSLDIIEKAKKEGFLVSFVMIDLDNFKEINDTYGHMFGDTTLVNVARIMTNSVGERGVVGRIGGDEFFIVLTGFEDGDYAIRPVIRSIRSHVQWYFKHRINDMKVTCSVGTSTFPLDADNYEHLFKIADHCLYIAKAMGRNRFIIYTKSLLGSLEDILNSKTVISNVNLISENEKKEHLFKMIDRFNNASKKTDNISLINDTLKELQYYYNVDSVQYCPADSAEFYFEQSNYEIAEPRMIMILYRTYETKLSELGYLSVGNRNNFKHALPELYEYMEKSDINSMLVIPKTTPQNEVKGVFVFITHKRYLVWSAFDTNMLRIICGLMERFL